MLFNAIPFSHIIGKADTVVWKNGGMSISASSTVGYENLDDGFTKLSVTDARGYIETPNLDEAPYYLKLSMKGLMPAGAETDGGRWAQLHISNGERNINWNPENEIYIEFPNAGSNPQNIKVKNTVNGGAQNEGVAFESERVYLFKFAKENNKLAIYCDDVKVFEGEKELEVFAGEQLWFITLGNIGGCDTYKDYPLCIDTDVEIAPIPPVDSNAVWKNGLGSRPEKTGYSYTADGFTKLSVTDARGYIETPNLDEAPYYLKLSMKGLMPAGAEADGGRWAQLHISNGERNINWNPENEIYIEFPNAGSNPQNIKVKNTVNGASQNEGIAFEPERVYLFKFAKENNKLAIYCDDVKVFEGEKELEVFAGEQLWFITLGNIWDYDTYTDYPLFIDTDVEITPESPLEPDVQWKNGGMSVEGVAGYSDMGNGFTKLSVTDARGCVKMPNLAETPYYMMLGMEKLMPAGAEAEGGRWAQFHISNGERNQNWNPENEIYIEFPNEGYNPKNIKVKNKVNGVSQFEGVPFAEKRTYLFKFAKEGNKLVIYCDDVKVFEGEKELEVFSGDYLWFITLGNMGKYDTYKDYPMFINALSDTTEEPPFGDIKIPEKQPEQKPQEEIPADGWKNGGMSIKYAEGYKNMDNGFTKLSVTDARGCVKMPDLSVAPYYMMLKSDDILPGGLEADGGRWGMIHISNGERNQNWNPENEIYIALPNSGANPKNIKVKNSIDGEAHTDGVLFAPQTLYIFKFAQENGELVIYCNGEKVFTGKEELDVFSGEYLWFITLGNMGEYDTYKDYPLQVNLNPQIKTEPATYYYVGPKWGADGNKPARDIDYSYLDDGSTKLFIKSRYDIEGKFDDIGQSISTIFKNENNKFEIKLTQEVFNFDTWQVIGIRAGDKEGSPLDEPDVLCLEITNGPSYQLYYRKTDGTKLELVSATMFELGTVLKLNFEVVNENGIEKVDFYANNVLVGTSDNSELVSLMKSKELKTICVGNTTYDEPNITVLKIDNKPSAFEATIPEDNKESAGDPYIDLVIRSKDAAVTVDGYLIIIKKPITAKQLNAALETSEGTRIYVMTDKEELATEDAVIDSTHSVMMLLDDQYETYVRSYNIYVMGEEMIDSTSVWNITKLLIILIPSVLVLAAGVVTTLIIIKKRKSVRL